MILDPTTESFSSFIGIDKFDEITQKRKGKTYYACAQIFDGSHEDEIMRGNDFYFGTLSIHKDDTFIIPNIKEYLLLSAALKTNKLIYNKKKGALTKKGG